MRAAFEIKTPAAYLANLPEPRQSILRHIHQAICKAAPSLKPVMEYGMIGYAPPKKRTTDERKNSRNLVIALASQKHYISLYLCGDEKIYDLIQKNKKQLGKVSLGKCCIRFKKLEDLNLPVVMKLVAEVLGGILEEPTGGFEPPTY
ncbi:MAG: DUF1801 domain-containing protein [Chthoniobacterales bacterium]